MKTIVRNTALTLLVFALMLILPSAASAACADFDDVPESADCYESVMYLAEHAITRGTGGNTFSPDAPITTSQWAVMLCRAYGVEAKGNSWSEPSINAVEQSYRKGWLSETALSAPNTQLCRGALCKSAFAAARIPVYDSMLYENGVKLSAFENCLRTARELSLCGETAAATEIVTRSEAAQLLYAVLTRELTVEAPPAPVPLENLAGVNVNDYLLVLRQVPEPILTAFQNQGWTYTIDYDYPAELGARLGISCIGCTDYSSERIYVSKATATLHEFGHFLDYALGFPAEHERLYLTEAQNSGLRDYARTNSREYFADCFFYWITYSADKKQMDDFRDAAPQTYAYMKKLAANNWGA